jgi:hypothetical protein
VNIGISRNKAAAVRACAPPLYPRALVVFGGEPAARWLRLLKPGFRHCFVALDDGVSWLTLDPLSHRLELAATAVPSAFDLAAHCRDRGLLVVEVTPPAVPLKPAPLGFFTCVEAVKRALGLHARRVLTPHQLYRHLKKIQDRRAPAPATVSATTILGKSA